MFFNPFPLREFYFFVFIHPCFNPPTYKSLFPVLITKPICAYRMFGSIEEGLDVVLVHETKIEKRS